MYIFVNLCRFKYMLRRNSMDKRTQKTKNSILHAVAKLLEKKSLEDITVTEVSNAANINRKTFYAHYSSVQDVIDETSNDIAENLLLLCKEMSNDYSILNPDILFHCLNTLSDGSPEQFDVIFANPENRIIINKFTNILQKHIKKCLEESSIIRPKNEAHIPFIAAFVAGGLMNVYCESGKKHPDIETDAITQLASKLILSGIESELNHSSSDCSH